MTKLTVKSDREERKVPINTTHTYIWTDTLIRLKTKAPQAGFSTMTRMLDAFSHKTPRQIKEFLS